jgi:hypothetical protein
MDDDWNREGIRAVGVNPDNVITAAGVTIAVITIDEERIGIAWLPELFKQSIPAELRALIVEQLRFHATKLESGEMEARMKVFSTVNENHYEQN